MIDLHFHVLAGIDDGPATIEDAVGLAAAARAAGVDQIVATPHVSWDWPNTARGIAAALSELREGLREHAVPVRVHAGAEIELTHAFELPDAELRRLHLGGGPWLLLEAPHAPGVAGVEAMIRAIQARGHRIVLAHVERCPAFAEDRELLARLVADGMLASLTAGSLLGAFGREARSTAHVLLERGLIHNVASDAHDRNRRPPGLRTALDHAGLHAFAPWLTQGVPEAVLRGAPIPPPPQQPMPARRRWRPTRLWR